MDRHPNPSVKTPPRIGPAIAASANTLMNTPCIFARVGGAYRSAIDAMADEVKNPPKIPWIARATMSSGIDWDNPQRADATRKPSVPPWRNRFRPKRSPSFPEIGMIVVEVTRYAVVTHA